MMVSVWVYGFLALAMLSVVPFVEYSVDLMLQGAFVFLGFAFAAKFSGALGNRWTIVFAVGSLACAVAAFLKLWGPF